MYVCRRPIHSLIKLAIILNGSLSSQVKRFSRISFSLRISCKVSCILQDCSWYFWQLNRKLVSSSAVPLLHTLLLLLTITV